MSDMQSFGDHDMSMDNTINISDQGKKITNAQKRNAQVREQMQAYFVRATERDYAILDAEIGEDLKKLFLPARGVLEKSLS